MYVDRRHTDYFDSLTVDFTEHLMTSYYRTSNIGNMTEILFLQCFNGLIRAEDNLILRVSIGTQYKSRN